MKAETNVWVPTSAVTALDVIKVREGYRSRNQTLERVLEDYVEEQRGREDDERLVHIATLFRWPPPRRDERRMAESLGIEPSGRQLRVRIDRDLWNTALHHGFVLPGQSTVRGHHEYQARRGADAVLTAIALEEPLDDLEIGATAQLLSRRQARGLWRLAVAGTTTTAERGVVDSAEHATEEREIACARGETDRAASRRVVRVAEKLLTSEVTWHASERFEAMKAIAAEHLTGDGAQDYLNLLSEVDDDTPRWRDELARTRDVPRQWVSREGRGATTVWRAERAIQIEDLMAWFGEIHRSSTPATFVMNPPGWQLSFPTEWIPTRIGDAAPELAEAVGTGQVLRFRHEGEDYVWPTRENDQGLMVPVAGFETVISEAGTRPASDVLEATLLDFSTTRHHEDGSQSVWVPAHVACDLGLLTETERDRIVLEARAEYDADVKRSKGRYRYTPALNIDVLFADLNDKGYYRRTGDRERARMAYAHGIRPFLKFLKELGYSAIKSEHLNFLGSTGYQWSISTLADAVQAGELDAQSLRWLAAYVLSRHHAILNADEVRRWISAEKYEEFDVTLHEDVNSALDRPHIDNEWAPGNDNPEAPF